VIISAGWRKLFGDARWPSQLHAQPYTFIALAEVARLSAGPITTEFALPNLDNEMVALNVELYSNQHRLFALMWKPCKEGLRRRRIIVPSIASVW